MKSNKIISIRVFFTIHFVMCWTLLLAQNNDLDKALKNLYIEYNTLKAEDFDNSKKEKILSSVSKHNYEGLSDSAKFIYHRFLADICHDQQDKENLKIHVEEAIKLSEKSVGILNPYYISLLMEQGALMEDINIDKAISIYQKAIIVSQTLLYNPKAQLFHFILIEEPYGVILNALADLYEEKGWTTRIEELYRTAFRFITYNHEKSDPITYLPIIKLGDYYQKKGDINRSMEIFEWILEDIINEGYYGSSAYVSALYHLGSLYSNNNQDEKSLDTYRTAVELVRDSLGGNDEILYDLYKNYCVKLAELNQFDELDKNLPIVQQYYTNLDSIRRYADMLFLITDRSINNRMYENADKYCDSLLLYPSYNEGYEEIAYSKKALILFMLNLPEKAQEWQERALTYCLNHNGENSIIYTNYLADLAFLYKKNSQTEKSITAYCKLIELLEKNNCDTIPFYNEKISSVCELYEAEQNYDLEYQYLKERKQTSFEKYGNITPFFAWICNRLSILEMNTGRLNEAKKNNQIAEKLNLRLYGRNSFNYAITLHNKGKLLMFEGKYRQALKSLKYSKEIQLKVNDIVDENTETSILEVKNKLK